MNGYIPVDSKVERDQVRFCGLCPFEDCVHCYVTPQMEIRRTMFQRARKMGFPAKEMFRGGAKLEKESSE